MLGVLLEQALQNLRRLQLVPVGLVVLRRGGLQGQGIVCPRLEVVGIALRHLLHRLGVRDEPGVQRHLVGVAVVDADPLDPVALALGLDPDRARPVEPLRRGRDVFRRRRRRQRIPEVIDGQPPVRDRAARILLDDRVEDLARLREPVRMQHRDAALELALHLGIAGRRERDLAELLWLREAGQRQGNGAKTRQRNRHDSHIASSLLAAPRRRHR